MPRNGGRVERELAELRERLSALEHQLGPGGGAASGAASADTGGPAPAGATTWEGTIRYQGEVARGEAELVWEQERRVRELVAAAPEPIAALLTALGSPIRHAIVRALLAAPASARELQERLAVSSQGHVHYHLKELIATGLVRQRDRGSYALRPAAVIPYLTILAAAADIAERAGGAAPSTAPPGEPEPTG